MKNKINLVRYLKHADNDVKEYIDAELSVSELQTEELVIKRVVCDDLMSCASDEEEAEGSEEVEVPLPQSIGYASTRKIDFSGDIVIPEGIDLSIFSKNPVIFYNHFKKEMPIGKAVELVVDPHGLRVTIQYAVEENPEAMTVYKLVRGGYLNQHSIGFLPLQVVRRGEPRFDQINNELMNSYPEYKGDAKRIILKSLLLEISIVNIADNQSSTIEAVKHIDLLDEADFANLRSLGLDIKDQEDKEIVEDTKENVLPDVISIDSCTEKLAEDVETKETEEVPENPILNIKRALNISMIKSASEIKQEKQAEYFSKMAKLGKIIRI